MVATRVYAVKSFMKCENKSSHTTKNGVTEVRKNKAISQPLYKYSESVDAILRIKMWANGRQSRMKIESTCRSLL